LRIVVEIPAFPDNAAQWPCNRVLWPGRGTPL